MRLLPFLILVFGGCAQQPQMPVPEPDTEKPQEQNSSRPSVSITQVPFFKVRVPEKVGLWPFPSGSIRFQRGFDPAARNASLVRPLGDAKIGPDNSLYLSFPQHDLVVAFKAPAFKTLFYGPKHQGGQNQLIKNPGHIGIWGDRLYLNNDSDGKIMVYDHDLDFIDMYHLQVPAALPGPDELFLLTSPTNPSSLVRADASNVMEQQYLLNDDASVYGDGSRLVFNILDQWQMVAARVNGSRIYHLEPNSHHIRQMMLDFSDVPGADQREAGCHIHAIRYLEKRYWLLFDLRIPGLAVQNLLLVIDEQGQVKYLFRTDFTADGFDLSEDTLLLFNRKTGAAETYRRK